MSAAKFLGVDFIQEVVSCKRAVENIFLKLMLLLNLEEKTPK